MASSPNAASGSSSELSLKPALPRILFNRFAKSGKVGMFLRLPLASVLVLQSGLKSRELRIPACDRNQPVRGALAHRAGQPPWTARPEPDPLRTRIGLFASLTWIQR